MKKLNYFRQATITAILLLVAVFCQSQTPDFEKEIKYKTYNDSTGNYLIKYELSSWFSVPMTDPPGPPHWDATLTVYKIVSCKCFIEKNDTLIIGRPFGGTYVEAGCFEDVPEYNVNQAKKLQLEAIKQNGH